MWILLLGRMAQFILMLVSMRIATQLLSPVEMGKIAIVMSTVALLSSLFVNPVGMYVNRQLHRWYDEGCAIRCMLCHYGYVTVVALLSSLGVIAASKLGILNTHLPLLFLVLFVGLTILFNTINQTAIPSLNLLTFRGWFTVLSVATVLFGLLFAWFFATYVDTVAENWLWGQLFAQTLLAIVGSYVLYRKIKAHTPIGLESHCDRLTRHGLSAESGIYSSTGAREQIASSGCHNGDQICTSIDNQSHEAPLSFWKKGLSVLQYAWPIAVSVSLYWCQSQSYRFLLESTQGLAMVGLFTTGYALSAGIMAGVEAVLASYFQPVFYREISQANAENRQKAWYQYASMMIPCMILVALGLVLLSLPLTYMILSPQFYPGATFVMWGALIEVWRVITNVYSMMAHAEQKTKVLVLPNVTGALLSVVLTYVLLPVWGTAGVVTALLVSAMTGTILLHVALTQTFAIRVSWYMIFKTAYLRMTDIYRELWTNKLSSKRPYNRIQ